MIGEAAAFADKAHKGAFRKGTKIPYITHPMETAVIVSAFTDDEEIIAAALLHDVMEDAGVTREELEDTFGSRVADLVVDESEDKSPVRSDISARLPGRLRYWLWGTSSATCAVRPGIIWWWAMPYGSGLMRRISRSMPGTIGG